jgi:peptidoglycan/xylan/chitin deacetylase (PgdA/CDA1 family)
MAESTLTFLDPIFGKSGHTGGVFDLLAERGNPPRLGWKHKAYYMVRPFVPIRLRQYLQHTTRPETGEGEWYIETGMLDEYARQIPEGTWRQIVDFWPGGKRWGLVLTHDVETEVGFRNIEPVVRLEERYGFRSSWNLVAKKYPIDRGYVDELKSRGFEVGIHGYNHDGKDYLSRGLFRRRVRYVNRAIREYGAVGFRSPQTHRNLEWMQELDVAYDSSCFDIDPFQPMPGGTGSIWPFRAGKFIEIPYTVPQDHVLFITLREETNEIWKRKSRWLIDRHALVCLITHPDYLLEPKLMAHYENYLAFLAEQREGWHGTPAQLAAWWEARERSTVVAGNGGGRVEGPAADFGATILDVGSRGGGLCFRS